MGHLSKKGSGLTTAELSVAMKSSSWLDRLRAMERYSRGRPTLGAVPILREALADKEHAGIVQHAAKALGKLGPAAAEAVEDLIKAAVKVDPVSRMPQSYPECLKALVAIQPDHEVLPTLIKGCIGLDNWVPLRASLEALKKIGTPESLDLLRRAATFWEPELDKMQRRIVERIVKK